jgi:ABC-2 type transport system permease protein
LVLVPLVMIAAAVSMLLSSLYVRFRDVSPIWAVVSMVLFYAMPVLYAINAVPKDYQRLVMFNPLADLLQQARRWIIDPTTPGAVHYLGGPLWALVPLAVFVAVCVLGVWVFDHEAPRIAERL